MGDHEHSHTPPSYNTAFAIGITLNLAFVLVEVVYGSLSHSLTLIADAGHNFSDVVALVLAWGAGALAKRPATDQRTYGLRRLSILAALANAVLLLVVTGAISWEAILRLRTPGPVAGRTMMIVAAIGVVINAGSALLFLSGRKKDLNLRAAFVHLAGDALVALGAVIAGAFVLYTRREWIDPLTSLGIALVVLLGTWSLLRESIALALDAVPRGIETSEVRNFLLGLEGVNTVHDLHIWGMSTTETALTAHLVRTVAGNSEFLAHVAKQLHERFRIDHVALQVETVDATHRCRQESPPC